MTVDTLNPKCLIAQIFNGTLNREKENKSSSLLKGIMPLRKNKANAKKYMYAV